MFVCMYKTEEVYTVIPNQQTKEGQILFWPSVTHLKG